MLAVTPLNAVLVRVLVKGIIVHWERTTHVRAASQGSSVSVDLALYHVDRLLDVASLTFELLHFVLQLLLLLCSFLGFFCCICYLNLRYFVLLLEINYDLVLSADESSILL
jgi:hypothetical protein